VRALPVRGADKVRKPYRLASVSLMHADKSANWQKTCFLPEGGA